MTETYISETSIEQVCIQVASQVAGVDGRRSVSELKKQLLKLQTNGRNFVRGGVRYYSKEDAKHFMENWKMAMENDDPRYLIAPRGLKWPIVGVEEFACSRKYLGLGGSVRYRIMQELNKLHSSPIYIDAVLGGGIGVGKNFFTDISLLYDIYKLSCLYSPQIEFGLAPGSSIVFVLQSITETLAKKIVFKPIREKVISSPYFRENFPPDPKIKTECVFPNNVNITPISSSDTSALGGNVLGAVIDEINFHPKRAKSAFSEMRGDGAYDKATILYQTLRRRMKSRFLESGGNIPGHIYLVASANYPQDFVSRKIEEAKEDKTIFVMNFPQWEAHRLEDGTLNPKKYCGKTFFMDIGDEKKPAKILNHVPEEDDMERGSVIEIPIEYLKEFQDDPDGSLRDIAGMPRSKKSTFMPAVSVIRQADLTHLRIVGARRQLFLEDMVDISVYRDNELGDLIDQDYIDTLIVKWDEYGFRRPPAFAMHIDAGLTSDILGIGIGRVMGISAVNELRSYMPNRDKFIEYGGGIKAPIVFIDGVMGVVPPGGDEIDLNKVQGLIFTMMDMGINIKWLSMDKFASPQMLQAVRKYKKIKSSVVSVDYPLTPYMDFKIAYREYRIITPYCPTLFKEEKELEIDRKKGKVDHPITGSKDLCDAVCGVHTSLKKLKETYQEVGAPINQYELAGITNPDIYTPPANYELEEPEEKDHVRRSRRNPNRPVRGATRKERGSRFRSRMV